MTVPSERIQGSWLDVYWWELLAEGESAEIQHLGRMNDCSQFEVCLAVHEVEAALYESAALRVVGAFETVADFELEKLFVVVFADSLRRLSLIEKGSEIHSGKDLVVAIY